MLYPPLTSGFARLDGQRPASRTSSIGISPLANCPPTLRIELLAPTAFAIAAARSSGGVRANGITSSAGGASPSEPIDFRAIQLKTPFCSTAIVKVTSSGR